MDRLAFPEELRAMVHSAEISPCEGREDAVFRFCALRPKLGREKISLLIWE